MTFKEKIALGALVGGAGLKIYAIEKGRQLYHRYQQYKEGRGIGPSKFAQLPRYRQRSILYYRRGRVKDLEGVYARGRKRSGAVGFFTP